MHIILFDDHELFAKTMEVTLTRYFESFTYYSEKEDIVKITQESNPDIVLMDIHMGAVNGLEQGKLLLQKLPETKLIFLSGYDLNAYHHEAIHMGAKAFINKSTSLNDLISKIKIVADGNIIFPEYTKNAKELSERETEVLRLAAEGMTQQDIADNLYISRRTVNSHIQSINDKFSVNSTVAAIVRGIELGIVRINI